MSLKVFFKEAKDFEIPENLELTEEGLRLKRERQLALHFLRKLPLEGAILTAERTPCDQLLVLLRDRRLFLLGEERQKLFSTRAEALAAFPGGLFLVGRERIRLLSFPRLRELGHFPGPHEAILSATVRRKRLYVLTARHRVLVYTFSGRLVTRVKVPSQYKALKAAGFLYWFDGENVIWGRKKLPLSRPLPQALFLPGRGGHWFLEPDGRLLIGEPVSKVPPDARARVSFRLPEAYAEGLLLLLGRGNLRLIFPQGEKKGFVAKIPRFKGEITVAIELSGEKALFQAVFAVPRAHDLLRFIPEAYREGAEAFLLPLFLAFRLIHDGLLFSKEAFLKSFSGQGRREELLFLGKILGFSGEGLPKEELLAWLSALPQLYRYRGSVRGMREVLRLCAGKEAFLREAILWRKTEQEGGPFTRLFGRQGNLFLVFVSPGLPKEKIPFLKKMVADWTPLGTEGRVLPLELGLTLGKPLALGVNTALTSGAFKLGLSRLGQDTRLMDRALTGRLDLRATLGRDAQI